MLSGFARQATIAWVRDSAGGFCCHSGWDRNSRPWSDHCGWKETCSSSIPANESLMQLRRAFSFPKTSLDIRKHRGEIQIRSRDVQAHRICATGGVDSSISRRNPAPLLSSTDSNRRSQLGDRQSERRYVAYNEPVARYFHHQLAPTLSAVAGDKLRPSYVYLASYLSGAELKKHVDRPQCEFSVTLCLDFSPEPDLATPWPIRLETPNGTVTVYQGLGDGLAYRGTTLPHYRHPLGDNQTSTSIFFHYVGSDFDGPLG